MERINFNYSTKNIPIPTKNDYSRRLIERTEQLVRRMRWKAFFFLNPEAKKQSIETYGFNSRKNPPPIPEMKPFEDNLLDSIKEIEYRTISCQFQNELKNDISSKINSNKDALLVKADKTTNYYKLSSVDYQNLLKDSITNSYKKTDEQMTKIITSESKDIAAKLELDNRIERMAEKEAFITLKDHKTNFENKPTCRLINPAKTEMGKVSKQILDKINKKVVEATGVNQWKKTADVLKWFNNLERKPSLQFVCFDIVDFYPSISEVLLKKALDFAAKYHQVSVEEREIVMHARRSLLFKDNKPWCKKTQKDLFDVTMGSFDGAETCELVGCYILSTLTEKFGNNIGLYRDDGLAAFSGTPQQVERIKKQICEVFRLNNLKITIEANTKIVNYLDVTLNLRTGKYQPYLKPGNKPLYVHAKSNHPSCVIRNIPEGVNKRLSSISSDSVSFEKCIRPYQEALEASGYDYRLTYDRAAAKDAHLGKTNRSRKIIWYNPPFSKNVKNNIGGNFLKLISRHFPKDNKLNKIFNKNTVKVSYSCMSNMKNLIDNNNVQYSAANTSEGSRDSGPQINNKNGQKKNCNCRKPDECPLEGNCLTAGVIYQATVSEQDKKETYIGLTENTFKTRYSNHKASFKNIKLRNATELSKHLWSLKDAGKEFNVTWKIIRRAKAYTNATKRCSLCLWEKFYIIYRSSMASLNKRSELMSTCRHAAKFLLSNS